MRKFTCQNVALGSQLLRGRTRLNFKPSDKSRLPSGILMDLPSGRGINGVSPSRKENTHSQTKHGVNCRHSCECESYFLKSSVLSVESFILPRREGVEGKLGDGNQRWETGTNAVCLGDK